MLGSSYLEVNWNGCVLPKAAQYGTVRVINARFASQLIKFRIQD